MLPTPHSPPPTGPQGREGREGRRDTVLIHELEVFLRVGVPEEERRLPQRLLLSVEMEADFSAAAAGDDLTRTIDYSAVARRLRGLGAGREWRLIETLAVEIAEVLLREFGTGRVRVEVRKFILPEARHVGVRVERTSDLGIREGRGVPGG